MSERNPKKNKKTNKKIRWLFAALDINGRIELYTRHLKKHFPEIEVESFVKFRLPDRQYKWDYTYHFQYNKYPGFIQWFISLIFFFYALIRYDVFYFISGETILTRKLLGLELKIYQLLKKKIIFHFVGADIRNTQLIYWRNEHVEDYFCGRVHDAPPAQTKWQKKLTSYAAKYSDLIFVATPDLLAFFKDASSVYFIPVFLNKERFEEEFKKFTKDVQKVNQKKFVILHAPSNPPIKGTSYILKVLNELKKERGDIEIINTTDPAICERIHPPYSVSKYTLYKFYKLADIVIDQILIGWYGLQTVEALYLGKEVICYIDPTLQDYLFERGIIHTCNKGLKHAIIAAIERIKSEANSIREERYRNYVIRYHTIENSQWLSLISKHILHGEKAFS